MTKREAHTFLNAARAGLEATQAQIIEALVVTGDLSGAKPSRPLPAVSANVTRTQVVGSRLSMVEAWE